MRRLHGIAIALVCAVLLPLSNFESAPSQPFDLKKCRQELEIMRGILKTTLGFASKELITVKRETRPGKVDVYFRGSEFSNIGAFYLAGQGAVFTIPASGLRDRFGKMPTAFAFANGNFNFEFDFSEKNELLNELRAQIDQLNEQLHDGYFGLRGAVAPALAVPPAPPASGAPAAPVVAGKPPQAPSPAQAPNPRNDKETQERMAAKEKELRLKLSELQEKVKKKGEEQEARAAKFREGLEQLKVFLVEALANHGDSLTIVKPNEYVNLIISEDSGRWIGLGEDGERVQREILSVQKSVITDYKAGKLTMDAFKQKVMDYMN